MNSDADAIAALISAVEQRLLVAVVRGDQSAVVAARAAVVRLKQQLAPQPQPQRNAFPPPVHSTPLEASGRQPRN